MKIKESSMVTTAFMLLMAIATFFVGKVSSQRADHNHRRDQERHIEEAVEKQRQRNELERVYHEKEVRDLHKHYEEEEDRLRDNWNLPSRDY